MTKRDKLMLVVLAVLVLILGIKSFVLDPYQPKNSSEEAFMKTVSEIMEEKYTGGLYNKLIFVRVVNIKEMTEKEKTYKDLEGNVQQTSGIYKAKIRKYVLGLLPYAEESILEGVKDES